MKRVALSFVVLFSLGTVAGCKKKQPDPAKVRNETCVAFFEKAKRCKLTNQDIEKGKQGFVKACLERSGNAWSDLEEGAKSKSCKGFNKAYIPFLTPKKG